METKLAETDELATRSSHSENAQIRFFELNKKTYKATHKTIYTAAGWKVASPATSGEFQAIAWHFAKKRYQQHTGHSAGYYDSYVGEARQAEAWTSVELNQLLRLIKKTHKTCSKMGKSGNKKLPTTTN